MVSRKYEGIETTAVGSVASPSAFEGVGGWENEERCRVLFLRPAGGTGMGSAAGLCSRALSVSQVGSPVCCARYLVALG